MENLEMLTGTFPVAPDQLAHDLAVAKLIKSGAVPASASGYAYYGAYIKYFTGNFETVIANRIPEESKMSVAKDPKTGKWYSKFRYTNWTGKRVQKKKIRLPNKTGRPRNGSANFSQRLLPPAICRSRPW